MMLLSPFSLCIRQRDTFVEFYGDKCTLVSGSEYQRRNEERYEAKNKN
jgi:hypothetical protein